MANKDIKIVEEYESMLRDAYTKFNEYLDNMDRMDAIRKRQYRRLKELSDRVYNMIPNIALYLSTMKMIDIICKEAPKRNMNRMKCIRYMI